MRDSDAQGQTSVLLTVFIAGFILWLLLVGTLNTQELISGAVVSAVVALLFYKRLPILNGVKLSLFMPIHIFIYILDFLAALVVANVDLAYRVLNPTLPIRPEVVEIETCLESDLGKLLLANTITLTPGTLSVDVTGNILTVHWVYRPHGLDAAAVTETIAGRFEKRLRRFVA